MGAGKTQIFNLTLMHVAQDHVLSYDAATKAAESLNDIWQLVVDDLLEEYDWTFAKKRVTLARLDAAPAWGFAYMYQLPSDYLRLPKPHRNTNDNGWSLRDWRKEGSAILTDELAVELLYIARVGPELFSAKFTMALSFRLASQISYDLTQNATLTVKYFEIYKDALNEAKHMDGQEQGKTAKASTWLQSRN